MSEKVSRWRPIRGKSGSLQWVTVKPYDKEQAFKKFNPADQGGEYALANPRHNNISLTPPENVMIDDVNNHISKDLQDWHIQFAGQIHQDLIGVREEINSLQLLSTIKRKFESSVRTLRVTFLKDHKQLLTSEYNSRTELNEFRRKHGVGRIEADYPANQLFHLALALLFIVLDGMANAIFFSDNSLGLLGGFFNAFVIAGANVAVSFIAGFLCLRYVYHKSTIFKALGLIGLIIMVAFIVLLLLAGANYREIIQRNPDVEFLTTLAFDPGNLKDMLSFVMIGIGAVVSVLSMWDGFTFDDHYPGFGKRYRKWKFAEEDVAGNKAAHELDINAANDRATQEIDAIYIQLDAKEKQLKSFEADMSTYFSCVDSYYGQAVGVANSLITAFRGAVEAVWAIPGSFPVTQELVSSKLQPVDPSELENDATILLQEFSETLGEARKLYAWNHVTWLKELETERKKCISSLDADVAKMIKDAKSIPKPEEKDKGTEASPLPLATDMEST